MTAGDPAELGAELVALPHVDQLAVVGQLALLEHDEDFLHVRRGQRVEVDHGVRSRVKGPRTFGRSL